MIIKQDAADYIKTIRNHAKRTYAEQYHGWILGYRMGPEPKRPANLSTMSAQAVRFTLIAFYPVGHPDQSFKTI